MDGARLFDMKVDAEKRLPAQEAKDMLDLIKAIQAIDEALDHDNLYATIYLVTEEIKRLDVG